MSSTYGENLHLTIFGQSHSPAIGVTVEGIPEAEAARWAIDFYGRELRVKYIRGMALNFR